MPLLFGFGNPFEPVLDDREVAQEQFGPDGVELAVKRKSPPGSYDKKMVHFSFWKLPKTDYTPRVADDRVGYFLTANQDWAKPTDARDIFNRYIDRWHLEKRDPSLSA